MGLKYYASLALLAGVLLPFTFQGAANAGIKFNNTHIEDVEIDGRIIRETPEKEATATDKDRSKVIFGEGTTVENITITNPGEEPVTGEIDGIVFDETTKVGTISCGVGECPEGLIERLLNLDIGDLLK